MRILRAIGIALPPVVLCIAALLAYDAWRRLGPDPDGAMVECIIASVTLIFAAKAARDSYFPRAVRFVPAAEVTSAERRRLRAIVFAVGATIVFVAATAIAPHPRDPIVLLGSGSFILIGVLVMFGAWRAKQPIDNETKLRMLWWILAGGFLVSAATLWKNPAAVAVFAVPALVFGILALRASARFARFGKTDLVWEHEPLRTGETIRGRILVSRLAREGDAPFMIRLFAYSIRSTRSGASLSDRLKVLWSSDLEVPINKVELAPNERAGIPIEFTLPPTAPSSGTRDRTAYSWQLDVKRAMRGIDYAASFPLLIA